MSDTSRRVIFNKHPVGWVTEDCFRFDEAPIPELGEGDVLVENQYLSLDPYMRGRMDQRKSYVEGFKVGEVMQCGAVGRVLKSNNPKIAEGILVSGMMNWETHTVVKGGLGLIPVPPLDVPPSYHIGALGMPGLTAWYGTTKICDPKEGETIYVSAASGAVGQLVGQIAKIRGARVVGSAGSDEKCAWAVEQCGYDACFNYKTVDSFGKAIHEHCPDGIDAIFENVGGEMLDAALANLNAHARIALCGMIAQYNLTETLPIKNLASLLINRSKIEGFIISEHFNLIPEFAQEVGTWFAQGKINYRESVAKGLDSAPAAFIGMLKGENFGKQIVDLT